MQLPPPNKTPMARNYELHGLHEDKE